ARAVALQTSKTTRDSGTGDHGPCRDDRRAFPPDTARFLGRSPLVSAATAGTDVNSPRRNARQRRRNGQAAQSGVRLLPTTAPKSTTARLNLPGFVRGRIDSVNSHSA